MKRSASIQNSAVNYTEPRQSVPKPRATTSAPSPTTMKLSPQFQFRARPLQPRLRVPRGRLRPRHRRLHRSHQARTANCRGLWQPGSCLSSPRASVTAPHRPTHRVANGLDPEKISAMVASDPELKEIADAAASTPERRDGVATAAPPAAAATATEKDYSDCQQTSDVDRSIAACTRIAADPTQSATDRALAWRWAWQKRSCRDRRSSVKQSATTAKPSSSIRATWRAMPAGRLSILPRAIEWPRSPTIGKPMDT